VPNNPLAGHLDSYTSSSGLYEDQAYWEELVELIRAKDRKRSRSPSQDQIGSEECEGNGLQKRQRISDDQHDNVN
jgi:hypothetical protein